MGNLLAQFRDHLLSLGISEGSIRNYISDVNHFLGWYSQNYPRHDLAQVNVEHSLAYRTHLTGELQAPLATVNRRLSSLRKFFAWAQLQQIISNNAMGGVSNLTITSDNQPEDAPRQNEVLAAVEEKKIGAVHHHLRSRVIHVSLLIVLVLLLAAGSDETVKEKITRTFANYPRDFALNLTSLVDRIEYERIKPIPDIVDINDIFGYTNEGKISPTLPVVFKTKPAFELSDPGLIANLNANYLQGRPASFFMEATEDKWIHRNGINTMQGALIIENGYYVPLRLENLGGKNDFLVAQSNGKLLFALQPGGNIYTAGRITAQGLTTSDLTILTTLNVAGNTNISGLLTASGGINTNNSSINAGMGSISGGSIAGATLTTTGNTSVGGNLSVAGSIQGSSVAVSSLTEGSVVFVGNAGLLAQNNANFFWDDANTRLGLGTATPDFRVDVSGNFRIEGSNQLLFGGTGSGDADVNLYRSAANVLKTDDDLVIGSTGNGKITVGVVDPYLIINTGTFQPQLVFRTTATVGADDFVFEPAGVERLRLTEAGNLNIVSGDLLTAGTSRLTNAGTLQNITGYTQTSGNFSISGTGTFSTGTGAISLNGSTSVTGANTLTVGTGATSLGGTLSVTGAGTFSSTLGVSGLLTASGGLTVTGATNINTSGANVTNIGTGTNIGTITIGNTSGGDLVLNDPNWNITGGGVATFTSLSTGSGPISGGAGSFTSIANSGSYTQSGTSANTFTGATTFSAAGTALSVTNNVSIGGTLGVTGSATFGSTGSFASTLTASNGFTLTTGALNLTSTSGALSLTAGNANALIDLKADDTTRTLTLNNSGADTVAAGVPETKLIVKAGIGQANNLVELQNSAGDVVARFEPDGDLVLGSTGGGKLTAGIIDPHLIVNTGTVQGTLEFRTTATAGADDFIFTLGGAEKARIAESGNLTVLGTLTSQSSSTSTFAGTIDMQNNLILNIGAAGTDFTSGGGLTLASLLTASNGLTLSAGAINLTATSGAISTTGLAASTIGTASANLTLSTTTSGVLALTSAGALNLTAGAASTITLANVANALNFDANTLSIDALNNRVGIGLSAPGARLEVSSAGDTATSYTARFQSSGSIAGAGGILFDQNGVNSFKLHTQSTSGSDGFLKFSYITHSTGAVLNDDILVMRSGNVGIGAVNPGLKLDVRGGSDITLAGRTGFLVLDAVGASLALDSDEIQAKAADTAASTLRLNDLGGDIIMLANGTGNVGIGVAPATKLDVTGLTLNTQADGTVGVANLTNTLNKNDALTKTFSSLTIKPTFNTGASNTTTTYNVLNIDTVNTATTGLTTNLIAAGFGGTVNFKVKSNGDVVVGATGTGKITAATVDPLYTIDGIRYSTFAPSMLGVKEEIAGSAILQYDSAYRAYSYAIDLNNQTNGSDMWVFSRVTATDLDLTQVLLTPSSSARTWYVKDPLTRTITFFSDRPVEVSYRLTAPRFDYTNWSTLSNETEESGLIAPDAPAQNQSSSLSINTKLGAFTENFETTDSSVTLKEAVSVNSSNSQEVVKSSGGYDSKILGVVVERSGNIVTVAPAGQVLVKASVENGVIKAGDHLTSSATKDGILMKATQAGRTLGVSLQPLSADGEVLIIVNPSWFDPEAPSYASNGAVTSTSSSQSTTFDVISANTVNTTNLNIAGVAIFVDDSGNLKINGNVLVSGKGTFAEVRVDGILSLYSGISAPNGLAINLGLSKAFEIKDSTGAAVASISDQGDIFARSIKVDEVRLDATAAQPSTGVAVFRAGGTALLVETTKITLGSRVIVTFKGNYAPATRYWISDEVAGESFTLNLDQSPLSDTEFSWWIVN